MAATEVTQRHGRLLAPSRDGRVFHAATAATGVAPGTSLGTTTAFSLHNPRGSRVVVAIQKAVMGYISGTLGAGTVFHLINNDPTATEPTGTAIVEVPAVVTGNAPKAIALTTATVAVTPKIVRPFCSLQASLASTAVAPWKIEDDLEGAILLPEGCTYSLHAVAAAGSTPLVAFGVTWEEIPDGVD